MPTNVTWNGTSYSIPAAGEVNWSSLSNFLIALGNNAAVAQEAKQAIRVATTTPVTVSATTDFTVVSKLSVTGAVAVNLPAGADGQMFVIVDGTGDAGTNNITITPNGGDTINGAATLVLNHNRQSVTLQYTTTGTDWKVLDNVIYPGTLSLTSDVTGTLPVANGGTGVTSSTGTGSVVLNSSPSITSPTLTTPVLGTPSSGTLTSCTGLPLTTGVTGTLPLANGGTNVSAASTTALFNALDPTTTKGDIIVNDGTNSVRLAAGTDGYALVADSAQTAGLKYAAVVTNPMDAAGQLIYGGASGAPTKLAAGSSGNILTSAGTSAPVWTNTISNLTTFSGGASIVWSIDTSGTAGNPSALTVSSNRRILFTSFNASRTVTLPTTSIVAGEIFVIGNTQAYDMVINASGGSALTRANSCNLDATVQNGYVALLALQNTPTTPAHWRVVELFESYLDSTTTLNNWGTNNGQSIRAQRKMNLVTLTFSDQPGNSSKSNTSNPTLSSNIPTRFCPIATNGAQQSWIIRNNAADDIQYISVTSAGAVSWPLLSGSWTSGAACIIYDGSMTYPSSMA